jgi:ribosomal protein L16 Arg81 hydroxylase
MYRLRGSPLLLLKGESTHKDLQHEFFIKICSHAGALLINHLKQLSERSESLTGTHWLCYDLPFYNTLLDHQIQDKKDNIVAAIIKNQEEHFSHLFSSSISTLQTHGEAWNQSLQMQAEELAQVLLQTHQLEKEEKLRSVKIAKQNETIQQVMILTLVHCLQTDKISFRLVYHKRGHSYNFYKES